jgi:hypothetical protein
VGNNDLLRPNAFDPNEAKSPPIDIDRAQADWDLILKRVNEEMDARVVAVELEPLEKMKGWMEALDQKVEQWRSDLVSRLKALFGGPSNAMVSAVRRLHDETRAEYSERVARLIMTLYLPSLTKAEELRRRAVMLDQMTHTIVAAAAYKARTGGSGKWPDKLERLSPKPLPALPIDIYGNNVPVHYLIIPTGIRLYSIGPNGRDDAGRRSPNSGDDIALGVPSED